MDPVANMLEQREIASRILDNECDDFYAEAERLAELVVALDDWRKGGGFDPYCPPASHDSTLIPTVQR